MKYKIIFTIILFIFSFLLIKSGVYFIKNNDSLMKTLKEKQSEYNVKAIDAVITEHTMIPGISGKKINLNRSYQKMKGINLFQESLLIFDEIRPNKTIDNIYDKIIISGNPSVNKVSIITKDNNNYCFTTTLEIDKNCFNKHTIHVEKISSNHLTKVKELVRNGIVLYLENIDDLTIITKYLKNNNYEIVSIEELIKE